MTEGEHRPRGRGAADRRRAGAHDRPVVFPGLDAPRRDHRGRRPDARQDAADSARACDRLRRQRTARARVPGPAARLRGERDDACSRPAPLPGPGDLLRLLAGRARERRISCARRSPIARVCCASACRSATAASSCGPRVTVASSRSFTRPSTRDWRPVAGNGGDRSRRRALRRLRLLPLGGAAPARRLCDFAYDEDLGGPVVDP